jgi:transposase
MRPLATRFHVRLSGVRDRRTRYRTPGDVAPKPPGGGYPAKRDAAGRDALTTLVHAAPEATLQELGRQWSPTPQVTVSQAPISRALTKLGRPRQKNVPRR